MAKALTTPRWIAWTATAAVVLVAALYAFHRLEQFLITDARFALNEMGNDPGSSPAPSRDNVPELVSVSGSAHASARAIEAVFAGDAGRSVYLIPLAERRASLRTVNWVKDAKVARFWPNRIVVGVSERKPVAFVSPASSPASPKDSLLIDEEGVILPLARDHFTLPFLSGVSAEDELQIRQSGVKRMMDLMKDLGDAGRAVSEVDVSDPDNLKIQEPFNGHTVTLLLGDGHFALRHRHFVGYYAQLQKEAPWAATLDLRVEDSIIAKPAPGTSAKPAAKTVVK